MKELTRGKRKIEEELVVLVAAFILLIFVVPYLQFSPSVEIPVPEIWLRPSVLIVPILVISGFLGARIMLQSSVGSDEDVC